MQACLQLFTCCFEFIARERATKQMRQRLRVGIASYICEWTALLYLRGFLCRITPTNTI